MPGGINGANAYSELKALQTYARNNNTWENAGSNLKERTRIFLEGQGPEIQFKRDVALWYGAVVDCDEHWKSEFLCRVFSVLYWGGLMVKRGTSWIPYAGQRIPICSAISHTARVLIQLPEDDTGEFWRWLWGDESPRKRAAATHGIDKLLQVESINKLLFKNVEELKKNRNVKHYGVNIALGGSGNHNIISGNRIDGKGNHGHLYIAYTGERQDWRHKAILLGAEQSTPFDKFGRKQGGFGGILANLGKLVGGVSDQYGGKHSILGGHSRYSSTGGDDFGYTKKIDKDGTMVQRIEGAKLYNYGPSSDNYYDGMFLELTQDRFDHVKEKGFSANMLGLSGYPPLPSRSHRSAPPKIARNQGFQQVKNAWESGSVWKK